MAKPGDFYVIRVPENGTHYGIPVEVIARHHAEHFAHEFADINFSLADTWRIFAANSQVKDWARNNMDWSDVSEHAILWLHSPVEPDYQDAWMNGDVLISTPKEDIDLAKEPHPFARLSPPGWGGGGE